jgi:hypothetical protein
MLPHQHGQHRQLRPPTVLWRTKFDPLLQSQPRSSMSLALHMANASMQLDTPFDTHAGPCTQCEWMVKADTQRGMPCSWSLDHSRCTQGCAPCTCCTQGCAPCTCCTQGCAPCTCCTQGCAPCTCCTQGCAPCTCCIQNALSASCMHALHSWRFITHVAGRGRLQGG